MNTKIKIESNMKQVGLIQQQFTPTGEPDLYLVWNGMWDGSKWLVCDGKNGTPVLHSEKDSAEIEEFREKAK